MKPSKEFLEAVQKEKDRINQEIKRMSDQHSEWSWWDGMKWAQQEAQEYSKCFPFGMINFRLYIQHCASHQFHSKLSEDFEHHLTKDDDDQDYD